MSATATMPLPPDAADAHPATGDGARSYWRRREQAARALAARAADRHIARIHLQMAEHYAALALAEGPTGP